MEKVIVKKKAIKFALYDTAFEAIGWAYTDCCSTLDAGGDPRKTNMADVIKRAEKDLGLKG